MSAILGIHSNIQPDEYISRSLSLTVQPTQYSIIAHTSCSNRRVR
jgi:hypothetical protein